MPEEYVSVYPRPDSTFEVIFDPPFFLVIKEARERKGIGIRELARKARYSHAYLILIEAGERKPSPRLLNELQKILELKPFFLITKGEILYPSRFQDALDLEQSPESVSYLIGILHTALREAGIHPLPKFQPDYERDKGIIARFGLGPEENYEILIRELPKIYRECSR